MQAAAGTRAKAIKALAGVIKVERQLLESGHEQGMVLVAISSALKVDTLQDSAVGATPFCLSMPEEAGHACQLTQEDAVVQSCPCCPCFGTLAALQCIPGHFDMACGSPRWLTHGVCILTQDEAASVRQAAVDLLGTNIGHNAELATIYFDIIRFASHDSFPSVRKAAIKILWESCITAPGFTAACEACVAVLKRVNDAEESIQELVGKVFHGLWFADAAGGELLTCMLHCIWQALGLHSLLLSMPLSMWCSKSLHAVSSQKLWPSATAG